jgi:XTP/dITP diphosphohydrolase
MKKQLIFATNNRHKLEEVRLILGNTCQVLSLEDMNCQEEIPETGNTLEENARIKALFVWNKYGLDCFADDTGLEVPALNNAPGVYSARYAGEQKNSEDNMHKIVRELANKDDWSAHFRTVIALICGGREYLFEGKINGRLIKEKRGNKGFGYDPIFVPQGKDKTFAELGDKIKNTISHRAIAVNQLKAFLYENLSE